MNSAEAQPSSKTRNERVMRREHVRKEEEREFEGMSKEEEDQIKQAIALSILDKNGLGEENEVSPTSEEDKVSQTSLPIDEDHTEKNTINSGQQLSDSQVSDGFGDNADEVGNVDKHEQGNIKEKDDNKDAQVSDGFGDNADEVGNVDKHKQGSIELDEKDDNNDQSKDDFTFPYSVESHSSPKQQEVGDNKGNGDNVEDGDNNGRCDNDKDDDNSDNSDKTDMDYECGRSSPLFESEPDICLVEDEDMTQISHQSSIHSEMDIFAVRKDRLSLKKRKREPVDTEQPRKTPKLETSVHNKKEEESSEIFPSSEPYIPLKCVDKRF
ncbi:uncharacterized protein [Antedon mediterranea]|uniref:uncharacterized protein n=1 Tax=Antedon mediterranea TaxID=105859 RepID=UPI003AF49376